MNFAELDQELQEDLRLLHEEAREHCTKLELEEFVDAMKEFSVALADCFYEPSATS